MRFGLREKLLIPIVVTIVAGMFISVTYSYFSTTEAIKDEVSKGLNREVIISVKLMDNWLEARKTDLNTWGFQQVYIEALTETGYYGKSARKSASEVLASLKNGYPYYDYLFLVDLKGQVIASSSPKDINKLNVKERIYFKKSLAGILEVSDIELSHKSGREIFVVSVPVRKDKKIVGVLAGAVKLSDFSSFFVEDYQLGKDGYAFLADKKGKVVAISNKKIDLPDISQFDFGKEMLQKKKGIIIYQHNQINSLSSFLNLNQTGWLFVETQSLDEAFASSRDTGKYSAITGIVILVIVSLVISLLLRQIVHLRLYEMLRVIGIVEKGNFDVRIAGEVKSDEIGVLTSAFNTMIQRLKETLENLTKEIHVRRKTEEELAKHRDNLEDLVKERTRELEKEISERKRVAETLRNGERRLLSQNKALRELTKHKTLYRDDLKAALKVIMQTSAKTLEVERSSTWLFNRDYSKIRCAELYELSKDIHTEGSELKVSDFPEYFKALESERTIPATDSYKDPRTKEFSKSYLPKHNIKSMLNATVWVGGRMVGVVSNEHTKTVRKWTLDEQNYAASIADFVSLALEASERKLAEKTKKDLELRLHRAEKMEAIGTLAGGVAHDLNNILSGLVSYPELLLMQLPDDSKLRKPITTIYESGKKAAAIVQDLLTLARRGVSSTQVVNMNSIITEYLNSPECQKLVSFHPNVEIVTHLESNLLNIKGSTIHLSKTIMNLVSNAAEAMLDGGRLSIFTENRYIDTPIRGYDDVEEGDYVVLTVSDTGTGISPDDIDRIFEPFYTKKKMGRSGTGLGMAVVWGTIKDHKGYIDLESTVDEGTTFSLFFPVTREEAYKDRSNLTIDNYMGNGETILVVDDVSEQREIASSILTKLGYDVSVVASGEEAVEYLKTNSIDLLVLDMIMDPGIDGLDTYKQIIGFNPGQKAIIASGFSETNRIKEALRLGVGQYLKKPYAIEKFGVAVKTELERS